MSQHMDAFEKGNRIRIERAKLKKQISENDRVLLRVLEDPPECMNSISIMELLCCQQRWGRRRSLQLLTKCKLRESRQLGELTLRQRTIISDYLEAIRMP